MKQDISRMKAIRGISNMLMTVSLLVVLALAACAPVTPAPSAPTALPDSSIPVTAPDAISAPPGMPNAPDAPSAAPGTTSAADPVSTAAAPAQFEPQYYFPIQDSQFVSSGTTIIIRYGPELTQQNAANVRFDVQGAQSGPHSGQTLLADDHQTVIFTPDQTFTPGEQVQVDISPLALDAQITYAGLSYAFTVAISQSSGSPGTTATPPASNLPPPEFPDAVTIPQDIPHYTVTKTSPETAGEGYIFVAPFYWTKSTIGSYLLILDNEGQMVYYRSMADALTAMDFKLQPNGLLSYYDQKMATFYLLDSHYQVVDSYTAGNGYQADLHDLQILPNGNALLMVYDAVPMDMSSIAQGGKPNATVTGLVIQEFDPSKNVIFEWRSWDHIPFTDTTVDLTEQEVDLVHGNALELANDGNLLLSSRNLSEITKIDLQTGAMIWRFGGKANMFKLVNGQPFAYQHDVRQLPNGDITVFDNQGTTEQPAPSHAIEYKLDESNLTATQVWEYSHNPPVFATYMGNTQRLASGNTFLDWGAPYTQGDYAYVTMTEVSPDNQVLFELAFDQPYVSYRAFRFPWQGQPDDSPVMGYRIDDSGVTLGYSWNGATEVASYRLWGGNAPDALQQMEEKAKDSFETQSHFDQLPPDECYFQVAALDQGGNELARSQVLSINPVACPMP